MYRTCLAVILAVALAISGCANDNKPRKAPPPQATNLPPYISGTITQYATLYGGGEMPVQGYGVVIGLGKTGSTESPPHLQRYLRETLLKHDVGSWRTGTEDITPGRILGDLDTAIVTITGSIPPGAPKGTRFDLVVNALPQTQTTSLEGGILMPADLFLSAGGVAPPGGPGRVLAEGAGSTFVNPFIDPLQSSEAPKLRTARIIGGGRVVEARPIRLQLLESDYTLANAIQRRINARFVSNAAAVSREMVAVAKNPSMIEIQIPPEFAQDYEQFLRLMMHLPVDSGPAADEIKARQIAEAIQAEDAAHEELTLVWEAMGRQVLQFIKPIYASQVEAAAFYAARTGTRLGDDSGAMVLMEFANRKGSAFRVAAISELGRHRRVMRATNVLRALLDDTNELVRVAAYEALRARGDRGVIATAVIGGEFELDIVTSGGSYVIYASQSERPRLVLFGQDMPVSMPLCFTAPGETLTVSSVDDQRKLTVFRKVPRTGRLSDTFQVEPTVRTLVSTLGSIPERDDSGAIKGLGLTYGQVVAAVYRLCESQGIKARFVLQPLPQVRKIYIDAPSVGRPDAPS